MEIAQSRSLERGLAANQQKIVHSVSRDAPRTTASPLWGALERAAVAQDGDAWQAALDESRRLHGVRERLETLDELKERLRQAAPVWTTELEAARGITSFPVERLADCWEWRGAGTWPQPILNFDDEALIGAQLESAQERLRRVRVQLASESAWLNVARSLNDDRRRALAAWSYALRRVGRGTGKYAPRWRSEANAAMRQA